MVFLSPRPPGYSLELEYCFSPFTLRFVVIAVLPGLNASVVNMDAANFLLSSVRPTEGRVTSRCGSCQQAALLEARALKFYVERRGRICVFR